MVSEILRLMEVTQCLRIDSTSPPVSIISAAGALSSGVISKRTVSAPSAIKSSVTGTKTGTQALHRACPPLDLITDAAPLTPTLHTPIRIPTPQPRRKPVRCFALLGDEGSPAPYLKVGARTLTGEAFSVSGSSNQVVLDTSLSVSLPKDRSHTPPNSSPKNASEVSHIML